GSDPIRTGLRAFTYSLRTAFLPFFFIFNTELLMIGVNSFWYALWVCCYSSVAVLLLCTVLQRHFLVRNTLLESLMLLITSFILFIPNICNDVINKPYKTMDLSTVAGAQFSVQDNDAKIKIYGRGENDI